MPDIYFKHRTLVTSFREKTRINIKTMLVTNYIDDESILTFYQKKKIILMMRVLSIYAFVTKIINCAD